MPRLFTAIEVPPVIGRDLAIYRGGMPGARWVEPADYHVTLRFVGDVELGEARELAATLATRRDTEPFEVAIDGLATFGGDRPRALIARVAPGQALQRLQAETEKLVRQAGLPPETRKFVPHVTLARFRNVRAADLAGFIARTGHFPPLRFTATRFVLYSSRDSVGGGPYVVEAEYPFKGVTPEGPEA